MGKLAGERKKKGVSEMGSFHTSIGGGAEERKGRDAKRKEKNHTSMQIACRAGSAVAGIATGAAQFIPKVSSRAFPTVATSSSVTPKEAADFPTLVTNQPTSCSSRAMNLCTSYMEVRPG